jgi:hypothetical protein
VTSGRTLVGDELDRCYAGKLHEGETIYAKEAAECERKETYEQWKACYADLQARRPISTSMIFFQM